MSRSSGIWEPNQQNKIVFVLVDSNGAEVAGLGTTFTLEISKNGGAFQSSAGTKAEIGSGWYSYLTTPGEADTVGPVAIKVTEATIVQQNLEYVVEDRASEAIEFTYTVTDVDTGNPIDGVMVQFSVTANGNKVAKEGITDSFGVVRDVFGRLPRLDPGTYFVFRHKAGYVFDDPDTEVVS